MLHDNPTSYDNPESFLLDNANIPHKQYENEKYPESDLKAILSNVGRLLLGRDYSSASVSEFIDDCNSFNTSLQTRDEEMMNAIESLDREKERLQGVVVELGERLETSDKEMGARKRDYEAEIANHVRGIFRFNC